MTTDARGVPVSMSDPGALEILEQAIREFQSYAGDPIATIDRALETRPDFALGHALKAAALIGYGEQRFAELARSSVAALEGLIERGVANDRERAIGAALRLLVDGDWLGAAARFDRALVDNPRDVIALQLAHLFDFVRGDALNLRNRVTRVLPAWTHATPGYSYVLGLHAFGLEECNQYPEAMDAAMRALALEPIDPWAVHAGVHCMEMQGHIDEGIQWLDSRRSHWAPSSFAFHNHWHLALLYLDRGDDAKVLEIFDRDIYPQDIDVSLVLVDATALLWRIHLLGVDVRSRMQRVADVWATKLEGERGFYAFNDIHAMLAFAVVGREDLMTQVVKDLDSAALGRTTNAGMSRAVGLPLARGIADFARGRYAECLAALEAVRDIAHQFGGSHAQRDLITLTIIEAARRTGRAKVATHYLNERIVLRPGSRLGHRLVER